MSRSTPVRLAALAALLFVLTLATARSLHRDGVSVGPSTPGQMVSSQITVPVEIIEAGEDPAILEVRVPR